MVDKQEIMRLLQQYFETTGKITISDKGLVSCTGNVYLKHEFIRHKRLPVAFDRVDGWFSCPDSKLITLRGAPRSVGGSFDCSHNQLTSLKHAPNSVDRDFQCLDNQLTTLEGAPKSVGGSFFCSFNNLTTLEHAPQNVGGDFYCSGQGLDTLEGLPTVPGTLRLSYNRKLPLLRCLLAKKVEFVPALDDTTIQTILNQYAGKGEAGAFLCGAELATAGYKENARW